MIEEECRARACHESLMGGEGYEYENLFIHGTIRHCADYQGGAVIGQREMCGSQEYKEDGNGVGEVVQRLVGDALRPIEGQRGGWNHDGHARDEEQAAACLVDHQIEALLFVFGAAAQEAEACKPASIGKVADQLCTTVNLGQYCGQYYVIYNIEQQLILAIHQCSWLNETLLSRVTTLQGGACLVDTQAACGRKGSCKRMKGRSAPSTRSRLDRMEPIKDMATTV